MGYAVAQLRKKTEGTNIYMENIEVTPVEFKSPNKFVSELMGNEAFLDYGLLGNFLQGQTYYLRFIIHRVPHRYYSGIYAGQYAMYKTADDMTFTLLLKNKDILDEENLAPQIIDTFTVTSLAQSETDIGANTIYYSYSTVFTPSKDYNLLGFRLDRGAYDRLVAPRKWLGPVSGAEYDDLETVKRYLDDGSIIIVEAIGERIIYSGENGDMTRLKNITDPDTMAGSKSNNWLKLGFQSRPGVLIVVNQLPIRVGRSGIYEINNGTMITSFMITAPQGSDNKKIDAFLLDYAYNS